MAGITGGASNTPWEIEVASKAGRVLLYGTDGQPLIYNDGDQPTTPKGIVSMGINDGMALSTRMDRFGSLGLASHQVLMSESFEGATVNIQRWNAVATTMAATQSSVAGVTINSGNSVAINVGYMLQSVRRFTQSMRQPMQFKHRARVEHYNNAVQELGLGDASTFNGAHTTCALFQWAADGSVKPIVMYNGSIASNGDPITGLNPNNYYVFDIFKDDDQINFVIQDTGTNTIVNKQVVKLNSTGQRLFSSTALAQIFRVYNTGTAPATAPHMFVTDYYGDVLDCNMNFSADTLQCLQQRDAVNHPLTGVQLAQFANGAQPASATLSNTAAGYTTLGGKFQFAAPVGALTDFCLFGFQVPAPLTMVITSIDIESWNTGAAAATTPTILEWFVAQNLTAVSLATANGRVGVGAQDMPVGMAVGGRCVRLSKQYKGGLVTGPGRFFDIGLRVPIGTATASQVISGQVNLEGFFI